MMVVTPAVSRAGDGLGEPEGHEGSFIALTSNVNVIAVRNQMSGLVITV